MKKILITGASRYIGSCLSLYLKKNLKFLKIIFKKSNQSYFMQ